MKDKEKLNRKIKELKSNLKDKELKIKRICDEINDIVESKITERKFQQEKLT